MKGNFLRTKYPENKEFIISGKISFYKSNLSIAHPDYIEEVENEQNLRRLENIYPLTRGISLKDIKKIINGGKDYINNFDEWLNERLINKHQFNLSLIHI